MPAVVSLDFKNGVYTIAGVTKTLEEVIWGDPDYLGPWSGGTGLYDNGVIIPGTGLQVEAHGGGLVTKLSGPAFTEAVKEQMRGGCEVTFTYNMDLNASEEFANTGARAVLRCQAISDSGWNEGAEGTMSTFVGSVIGGYNSASAYQYEDPWAYVAPVATDPASTTVTWRIVGDEIGQSYNGGPMVTAPLTGENAVLIAGFSMSAHARSDGASGGDCVLVVEKVEIFSTAIVATPPRKATHCRPAFAPRRSRPPQISTRSGIWA